MLTEEILPLILIEDSHGAEILDGFKGPLVVDCHGIGLIDNQVILFPPFSEHVIRLIQQDECIFLVQHIIQHFFYDVDLIDHHIFHNTKFVQTVLAQFI